MGWSGDPGTDWVWEGERAVQRRGSEKASDKEKAVGVKAREVMRY